MPQATGVLPIHVLGRCCGAAYWHSGCAYTTPQIGASGMLQCGLWCGRWGCVLWRWDMQRQHTSKLVVHMRPRTVQPMVSLDCGVWCGRWGCARWRPRRSWSHARCSTACTSSRRCGMPRPCARSAAGAAAPLATRVPDPCKNRGCSYGYGEEVQQLAAADKCDFGWNVMEAVNKCKDICCLMHESITNNFGIVSADDDDDCWS